MDRRTILNHPNRFFFWHKIEVYSLRACNNYILDLASATIAEMTGQCTVEVIHIERATVSHFNVS